MKAWDAYIKTLNDGQLREVYRKEHDREERYGPETKTGRDSRDAAIACIVEAAKRGITL